MGHFETYSKKELKISYDSGETWESTTPPVFEYEKYKDFNTLYDAYIDLPDCVKAVFFGRNGNIYTYYCGDDKGDILDDWPGADGGYKLLVVGKCVRCIADEAFYRTTVDRVVFAMDGELECIGNCSFYMSGIKEDVIIPPSVTLIRHGAFGCNSTPYYEIQGRPLIEGTAFVQGSGSRTFKFLSPIPPVMEESTYNCIFHCGNINYYCTTFCNYKLMYPAIGTEQWSQYDMYFQNVERFDM